MVPRTADCACAGRALASLDTVEPAGVVKVRVSAAPITLECGLHLAVHVDHDGARRRVCERARQRRRLVVVVVVDERRRVCHRKGRLALCRRADAGVCANAAPINPPVPSVATLASRNLRIPYRAWRK